MPIELERPEFLYLLALLPLWWTLVWPRAGYGIRFTRGDSVREMVGRWRIPALFPLFLPIALRSLAIMSLVIALADPYRVETVEEVSIEGMGIGIVVDLSTSMLATDMEDSQDRLTVARSAAIDFARSRPHDELSLIGFAGQPVTRVPPTRDLDLIEQGVETLEIGLIRDGTDISAALLASANRLLESEQEPRVVVLLTDGAHNGVGVPPLAAARAAAALGVRVHAMSILGPDAGVRPGMVSGGASGAAAAAERMRTDMRRVLEGIADITGGRYFHASSGAALDSIYAEIGRIETPVEVVADHEERRPERGWPLAAGLLFLGLEFGLKGSRWEVIP